MLKEAEAAAGARKTELQQLDEQLKQARMQQLAELDSTAENFRNRRMLMQHPWPVSCLTCC